MRIKRTNRVAVAIAFVGALGAANAATVNLVSTIDGAQANAGAGTGSAGTGSATMTLDTGTNTFSWNIAWQDLSGPPTVAHFHGPAAAGVNAGVQLSISTTSPAIDTAILTAGQITELLDGLWYINIHTDDNPGGEIRGQVLVDTDNDGEPDATDVDDDNDGIRDDLDTQPLVANNDCTDNDGADATLIGATVSAEQRTCAARESVDVSGITTVGVDGNLRLISEKVGLTDTSVTENGSMEVINADPCAGCPPPPPPPYAIGDTGPAGGVVFYVTDEGLHGLEAAPADAPFLGEWGCEGDAIVGVEASGIGTGAQNTANIIAGCATAGIAAREANSYTANGFEDWFVPSKDELNELRLQRDVVDGFVTSVTSVYWSSTACNELSAGCVNNVRAWCHRFDDIAPEQPREVPCARSQSGRLRPVREF